MVEVCEETVNPASSAGEGSAWCARGGACKAGTRDGGRGVESGSAVLSWSGSGRKECLRRSVESKSFLWLWYLEGKRRWRKMGMAWVSCAGTESEEGKSGVDGRVLKGVAKKAEVFEVGVG